VGISHESQAVGNVDGLEQERPGGRLLRAAASRKDGEKYKPKH